MYIAMNEKNGSPLHPNICRIFTITLAVDSLVEAVQTCDPLEDGLLLKNTLSQLNWIHTEITDMGDYVNKVIDEHRDHHLSLRLRSTFRRIPRQLDRIHYDAIQANLHLISGEDFEEELNSLQANLYDLRNTVYRSYTSLSSLHTVVETS
jgi:hypothetical protein